MRIFFCKTFQGPRSFELIAERTCCTDLCNIMSFSLSGFALRIDMLWNCCLNVQADQTHRTDSEIACELSILFTPSPGGVLVLPATLSNWIETCPGLDRLSRLMHHAKLSVSATITARTLTDLTHYPESGKLDGL